ncbi:MAG: hypothetical protein ATN31_00915 [Candidatus Epulonipiscioides saccharophilum]|nr:MAG: hypothetical protein ATN31_00915 [Epulopiscium sp. AS2M-Bin001]
MKIGLTVIAMVLIFLSNSPTIAKVGTLGGKGAVVVETSSMRVLYGLKENEQLPMASTTKIMTAILAIEEGNLEDVVTVSANATKAPPVDLKLQTGEKQYLGDLLYSLMLQSHNDTAIAIAEHIGGNVEKFCEMMTDKAHELGALNTNFETPNGLDSDGHYSTPYDLAIIGAYALKNPKFVEIINTAEKTIPTTELEGAKKHELHNKNGFLNRMAGANGIKTGFTSKAGYCFVGSATRNEMTLVGVSLGNFGFAGKERKYTDVKNMMEHVFSNYIMYTLMDDGQVFDSIAIKNGKEELVKLVSKERIDIPLTKEEMQKVTLSITKPDEIKAPVSTDLQVARIDIILEDEILKSSWLYPEKYVKKLSIFEKLKKYVHSFSEDSTDSNLIDSIHLADFENKENFES